MENREYFENLINQIQSVKKTSGSNKDCYIFPNEVVLKMYNMNCPIFPSSRQLAISKIKSLGFKTPAVKYYQKQTKTYYEVQERANGNPIFPSKGDFYKGLIYSEDYIHAQKQSLLKLLSAPDEQFAEYIQNFFIGFQLNILFDNHSQNLFYDEKNGFSFIDLPHDIPCYNDIEQYKKDINNTRFFETTKFQSDLFYPFKAFGTNTIQNNSPYFNLLCHKLSAGLKLANLPLDAQTLDDINGFLLTKEHIIRNGNNNSNHDELILNRFFKTGCSDSSMKLFLLENNLINGSPDELEQKENIKNETIQSPDFISETFNRYACEQDVDAEFLNECLLATTIDEIPAKEYFENYQIYNLSISNLNDNTKTDNEPQKG